MGKVFVRKKPRISEMPLSRLLDAVGTLPAGVLIRASGREETVVYEASPDRHFHHPGASRQVGGATGRPPPPGGRAVVVRCARPGRRRRRRTPAACRAASPVPGAAARTTA